MEIRNSGERMRLDRIQSIFKMRKIGRTIREIGIGCRCSPSTVSETLNKYKHKCGETWEYMNSYEKAKYVYDKQKAAVRGRRRFKGHIRDAQKREYVEDKLINKEWSPEIISHKIWEEKGLHISTNSIYRYVKKEGRRLKQHLYERGKPRRQRVTHRRGRFRKPQLIEKVYIDKRPESINSRQVFGHLEGDLVKGPQNGSGYVLLSLIERKTRFKEFIKLPNAKAETVLAYIRAFFMRLPHCARLSITFDNGSEFCVSVMHKLEELFPGFKVYYTDTYSPQQKGSDEHANGRLRRAYPKKTEFAFVTNEDIKREVQKLNNRPMKLLGFRTPQEEFNAEVAKISLQFAA